MGRFSGKKSVVKQDNMVLGITLYCVLYQVLTKHGTSGRANLSILL